jgi:hypothetical protein
MSWPKNRKITRAIVIAAADPAHLLSPRLHHAPQLARAVILFHFVNKFRFVAQPLVLATFS